MTHICAWCFPNQSNAETTHGICQEHSVINVNHYRHTRFWMMASDYGYYVLDLATGGHLPCESFDQAREKSIELESRWIQATKGQAA